MLVELHQYRDDDATDSLRSEGSVEPETDAEEYMGEDELEPDEWERVERDGRTLQRRTVSFEEVSAVSLPDADESAPNQPEAGSDPDLPGRTVQVRFGGGTEYVEQAELVEAVDPDP